MKRQLCSAMLLTATCFAGYPAPATADSQRSEPVIVGLRKQLFVDDFIVAEQTGVKRELGKVTKANGGKPVFTGGRFYGTVLHIDGQFRMWYRKHNSPGYGVAVSGDGLKWTHHADVTGIPFAGDVNMAITLDAHETDPQHRYKAGFDGPGMAAALAHSADGIRWKTYNNGKAVTHRAADTYNQILWDPHAKLYRLFTRTDFGTAGGTTEIRGNRGMINRDLKSRPAKWKTNRNWIFDREGKNEHERRQVYALTDWISHGVHFGLMSVYEWPGDVSEGPADLVKRHERDVMNFYIGTSRDGDAWDLSWVYAGQPIVPRGPDGSFDKDIVFPASEIVTHNDKHWLFYDGANERHGTEKTRFPRKHAIGVATLRLDGFVALHAGKKPGIVTTKPFQLAGTTLEVNADATAGRLAVEVLDEAGQPIKGFARAAALSLDTKNGLRLKPAWRNHNDLRTLKGRTIRLRFYLRSARLYAFQVRTSSGAE